MIVSVPGVAPKGKAIPYKSANGHKFSFLTKEGGLVLRLPRDDREAFLAEYDTILCSQYGTVMKDPDALLAKTAKVGTFFVLSHDYVRPLKPKPKAEAQGFESRQR